jgi:hypothetical protein
MLITHNWLELALPPLAFPYSSMFIKFTRDLHAIFSKDFFTSSKSWRSSGVIPRW